MRIKLLLIFADYIVYNILSDFTQTKESCQDSIRSPNPQARFLTCGKDRFFTFSAALDECRIKVISTDAMTRFILDTTIAACGFGRSSRVLSYDIEKEVCLARYTWGYC